MKQTREDRWQHLCFIAEQIEDLSKSIEQGQEPERSMNDLVLLLDSVVEVFPKELDPASDFEGYSIRQLAKALRRWASASLRQAK